MEPGRFRAICTTVERCECKSHASLPRDDVVDVGEYFWSAQDFRPLSLSPRRRACSRTTGPATCASRTLIERAVLWWAGPSRAGGSAAGAPLDYAQSCCQRCTTIFDRAWGSDTQDCARTCRNNKRQACRDLESLHTIQGYLRFDAKSGPRQPGSARRAGQPPAVCGWRRWRGTSRVGSARRIDPIGSS